MLMHLRSLSALIVACARIGAARCCCCRPYHDGLSRNSFFSHALLSNALASTTHTTHTHQLLSLPRLLLQCRAVVARVA
jgi:hypothetical protein